MTTPDHDENLRDLAAMFAMCGLIMRNDSVPIFNTVEQAFKVADRFMEERSAPTEGIASIKKPRKKKELE